MARRTLAHAAGVVFAGLLTGGLVTALAGPAQAEDEPEFTIQGEEITESSGLVIARSYPDTAYTVNDSGDEARIYVLNSTSGAVIGVTTLEGIEPVDVEALGTSPEDELIVADIGDNDSERDSISIHVLPEPAAGSDEVDPETFILRYPDGAHDAEAIFVHEDTVYVVTKAVGNAAVYAAPIFANRSEVEFRLRKVADAPPLVTDATVLSDGRVAFRDYSSAMVFSLPNFKEEGWFELPRSKQGETLAAAPEELMVYAGSEGKFSPVYKVEVPPQLKPPGSLKPGDEKAAAEKQPVKESKQSWFDWLAVIPTWLWLAGAALVIALSAGYAAIRE